MTNPGTYRPDQYTYAPENRYGADTAAGPIAPRTNGGWAAATLVFFWPLAFVAFSRALSVPMLWAEGRYQEAQDASASVARLGKIAVIIGIVLTVLLVLFYVVVILMAVNDAATSVPHVSVPTYPDLPSYSSGGGYN